MTKTMAEVLAEHSDYLWRTATGWECVCGHAISFTTAGALVSFTNHQAAALSAAGFGLVADAGAKALEDAADDFESNVGVGEFAELSTRDGAYWLHINEAWEHQGPYMDWLRARAAAVRGEG